MHDGTILTGYDAHNEVGHYNLCKVWRMDSGIKGMWRKRPYMEAEIVGLVQRLRRHETKDAIHTDPHRSKLYCTVIMQALAS